MCDKPCRIEEVYGNPEAGVFRQAYAYSKASSLILPDQPLCLGVFQFTHNAHWRGKALLGALVAALVA